MDDEIRQLERRYQQTEDSDDLERLVLQLFRRQAWNLWTEADPLFSYVQQYLDREQISKWLNVYEDYTARTTLYCTTRRSLLRAQDFVKNFYATYPILYQGRDVNVINEGVIYDPPAKLKLRVSDRPNFHFEANHKGRREINLHGQRETFVSFKLVEEIPDPNAPEQPNSLAISPTVTATEILDGWPMRYFLMDNGNEQTVYPSDPEHFNLELSFSRAFGYQNLARFNIYNSNNIYGGPEEGGWWYDYQTPLGTFWLGTLPADRSGQILINMNHQDHWPEYLTEVHNFLIDHYEIIVSETRRRDDTFVTIQSEIPSETPPQHYE